MTRSVAILFSLPLICLLVPGCAFPHVGTSSSAVKGRVVDAKTAAPIAGVTVALFHHPEVVCRTDRSGYFHLPATHYSNWFMWGPCPYYTQQKFWSEILEISHPAYEPVEIDGHRIQDLSRKNERDGILHVKDILLNPAG